MNNDAEGERAGLTWRPALLAGGEWPSPCMPPSLDGLYCTACPGLELLSCELLAKPVAVADVLVYRMYTKHRHELYHARKAWNKTLERPLPPLWAWTSSLLKSRRLSSPADCFNMESRPLAAMCDLGDGCRLCTFTIFSSCKCHLLAVEQLLPRQTVHCKKILAVFPSPAGINSSLPGINL
jgi:hypothetical protein